MQSWQNGNCGPNLVVDLGEITRRNEKSVCSQSSSSVQGVMVTRARELSLTRPLQVPTTHRLACSLLVTRQC